ncbi:hypothetical protein K435DRAFT_849224 [Dendrothele bispora CBS 962.96]|uniref:Uncharacterized protein n=1 Tax=Dendrothele bispora (strain CBS 962.96) TaxID=1314807 RepID=A0A4V4HIC8_DENBC|nr:hypothetical protein K435DRAFT_849224 [Dendrothele bispora CBS 962.96]
MAPRHQFIKQHMILISPRIQFELYNRPLPDITARFDFDNLQDWEGDNAGRQQGGAKPASQVATTSAGQSAVTATSAGQIHVDFPASAGQTQVSTATTSAGQVATTSGVSPRERGSPEPTTSSSTSSSSTSSSSTSSSSTGLSSSDPTLDKYQVPRGQPNRPNCGGYSLEKKLLNDCNWTRQDYESVMEEVRILADARLNTNMCYRWQEQYKVKRICQKVADKYPFLAPYVKCWPVTSMLKVHLKKTSQAYRATRGAFRKKVRGDDGDGDDSDWADF